MLHTWHGSQQLLFLKIAFIATRRTTSAMGQWYPSERSLSWRLCQAFLARTGDFSFSIADVDWLFLGGSDEPQDDPVTPVPDGPKTPSRSDGKRHIKPPPIIIDHVQHVVKNLPAKCYNEIEEDESGLLQFRRVQEGKKYTYPQYRCSFAKCKKKK
jgi:hypothetical protein